MHRRTSSRPLAALVALLALLSVAACSGDDEADDASGPTTSASTDSGTTDEDGSSTTEGDGGGGTTTTAAPMATTGAGAGGVTSTAPPRGTDAEGVIELTIVGGEVQGGVRRERVAAGSEVTLRVTSDVADELHVHTYDLTVALVPGRVAELTFIADVPGVHEVELEERRRRVLHLEVGG